MDLDEIVAEMHRKPDAGFLLEWISDNPNDPDAITEAIYAYNEAVEDQ